MTAFCNFTPGVGSATANTVNGASVSSLVLPVWVMGVDDIIFIHVMESNTAGGQPAEPTITDTWGQTWTRLNSLAYDGTNGSRHGVYWTRAISRGHFLATISFGATISVAGAGFFTIIGAHLNDPIDLNANSLKNESHTASAASSISGLSTTSPDTVLIAFYGSRTTVTDPGAVTGFTNLYAAVTNVRLKLYYQVVTSAQSSISIAFPTSTATGSMIAVGIRPRDVSRRGVRWIQGFDTFTSVSNGSVVTGDALNGTQAENECVNGSSVSTIVTGRDGVGKAYRVAGSSLAGLVIRQRFDRGFFVSGGGVTSSNFGQNGNLILDGEHIYLGFNVKIGTTVGSSVNDRNTIFGFVNSTTNDRMMFSFDKSTHKWHLTLAPGTSGGTSPTTASSNYNYKPATDPYQRWVWVELHLYRHASAGKIEMWQERSKKNFGLPLTGGVLPPPGQGLYTGMEKVFDYTGDTSVATLGSITAFTVMCDNQGSNKQLGSDFDDMVFSIGDRMGEPCIIKTYFPTSDFSVSGWAPDSGTDHFAAVDAIDRTDYLTASTGNPFDKFGFSISQTVPKNVFCVQTNFYGRSITTSASKELRTGLLSSSASVTGAHQTVSSLTADTRCILNTAYDPATLGTWSWAAARDAKIQVEVPAATTANAAQSLTAEKRVYEASKSILITLARGQGIGGTPDAPQAGPGDQGGLTDEGNFWATCFQPIRRGMVGVIGNMHPIQDGLLSR